MFRIRFYLAWPFAKLAYHLSPREIPEGYAEGTVMETWYWDAESDLFDLAAREEELGIGA